MGRRLTRGDRNIAWIQKHIRVPEGKDVGKPLKLRPFQKRWVRKIYDNPAGTRRVIITVGRKNAKTTFAACLLLLHNVGPEALPNSQQYSTAQSREQAAVVFNLAAKMVRMSPDLDSYVKITDSGKKLQCPELGTTFRALSAEAPTAMGLSPVLNIHDELGQVKGPRSELYDALETAVGAHDNPLSIIISTQAPTDGDLLSILIDDAKENRDPKTVLIMHTAPDDLDPFSVAAIKAANPAYGDFLNAEMVKAMAADAKAMPARQAEYENLILNRRVEANAPFISRPVWEACGKPVASFEGLPVYGGLDLSETRDLTALVLVAPVGNVWHVKSTFWLPGDGLAEKSRLDRVPYDVWAKQGYIEAAPGKTVDYAFVAEHLRQVVDEYDVQTIAFDRWNWRHLKPWLEKAGFADWQLEGDEAIFEEFGQGFKSMSPALRDLETEIANERMAHGGHPVLSMCAANAVVDKDSAGNRKLNKMKSHGRIDGMVALAMAMSVAGTYEPADADAGPPMVMWA